jgi:very-short-patch-repair endonuclease
MYKICSFCKIKFKTWRAIQKFCSRKCSVENYKLNYSGNKSPNYGVTKTSLAKEHIRQAKLGHKNPMFGKTPWNKGLPCSEQTKQKISVTKKELIRKGLIITWNKGMTGLQIPWNKGLNKDVDKRILLNANSIKMSKIALFKDPVRSRKFTTKSRLSHKKFYRENPNALKRLREIRSRIVYPKVDSKIEKKMQEELLKQNIKFVKQFPFYNENAETRMDMAIPELKIAIYCDGDYWHNLPSYKKRDKKINDELVKNGWTVFRFWEHQINSNAETCVNVIKDKLIEGVKNV